MKVLKDCWLVAVCMQNHCSIYVYSIFDYVYTYFGIHIYIYECVQIYICRRNI